MSKTGDWQTYGLSLNLYTYVHNNPLTNVDPTGHWCEATVNGVFYSHEGACNNAGGSAQKDTKYTDDKVYAANKLKELAKADFSTAKNIFSYIMNSPIKAVTDNKDTINQVGTDSGVSAPIIGAIIFREQYSRKDADLVGDSVGLGAITVKTARQSWGEVDPYYYINPSDKILKKQLKNDDEYNIQTIATILISNTNNLLGSEVNTTNVAYYNSSMTSDASISKGNHYAEQISLYVPWITILLK